MTTLSLERDAALATAMAAAATAELAWVTAAAHAELMAGAEYDDETVAEAKQRVAHALGIRNSITKHVVAIRDTDYPPVAAPPVPATARPVYNDAPADDGQRRCKCGAAIKGNFAICYVCKMHPDRIPGVCVTPGCGGSAKPEFATCWECYQKRQNGGGADSSSLVAAATSLGGRVLPAYNDEDAPF